MEQKKIRVDILPNKFLKTDGTFDKDEAIKLCGKIAGVCYNKEGFSNLEDESIEKTMRRVNMTLSMGHHSVYDHVIINFNIQNIPKILAMVLNNGHQYTTSEKSARYTEIVCRDSVISSKEEILYNKWLDIFKLKITGEYSDIYNKSKIQKLAQENARYLVTVFMPTQMIYSTSLRQINYIVSWMEDYINSHMNSSDNFENKLSMSMKDFITELNKLNVLEPKLERNEKYRSLSLFGKDLDKKREYFGDVYSTTYKGSFAELAQAHRHRTLDYQMEILEDKEFFLPPILKDDKNLIDEWFFDMETVKDVNPQGELVLINEMGKYEDFILKCKERLCSSSQLEIANQTRETLLKYKKGLQDDNNPLADDILKYTKGARCTFPDFDCAADCKFKEGKTLVRKI